MLVDAVWLVVQEALGAGPLAHPDPGKIACDRGFLSL
jgi:hypothetical protein